MVRSATCWQKQGELPEAACHPSGHGRQTRPSRMYCYVLWPKKSRVYLLMLRQALIDTLMREGGICNRRMGEQQRP